MSRSRAVDNVLVLVPADWIQVRARLLDHEPNLKHKGVQAGAGMGSWRNTSSTAVALQLSLECQDHPPQNRWLRNTNRLHARELSYVHQAGGGADAIGGMNGSSMCMCHNITTGTSRGACP